MTLRNTLLVGVMALSVLLISGQLVAQTYTIPFAEKQPAWVFPLWFTNGDGQRDTIYLAYDPEASEFAVDTIFGEYTTNPSPGTFQVRLGLANRKVTASNDLSYSTFLLIYNRIEPFIINFDARMFYSDSLPGIPSELVPKVWGGFGGSGFIEDCPTIDFDGFFVALADTTIDGYPSNFIDNDFCARDSIIRIEALTGITTIGLAEWNPPTGLPYETNTFHNDLNAWLFENSLTISVNSTEESELKLYHISGVLIYQKTLQPGSYVLTENLASELEGFRGPLLLSLVNGGQSVNRKVVYW